MFKKAKKIIFSTILVAMFCAIALGVETLGDYIAAKKVTAVMEISAGENLEGMDLTDSAIKKNVRSLFFTLNLISLGKNSSYFQRDNIRI